MQYKNSVDVNLLIYQNPAILSYLIHNFLISYSKEKRSCYIELLYYILPILLIDDYYKILSSTQLKSGFDKFLIKFVDNRSRDILFRLKYEAKRYFKLTNKAIYIGHTCGLFAVNRLNAQVSIQKIPINLPRIPIALKRKFRDAEKLGCWLSERSDIEVISLLRQGEA